jgi:CBS domain-containing protein
MTRVRDFMTTDVVSVGPESDLNKAAQLMKQHDVGILPVVEGEKLCGVVTDRDIVIKGLAEGKQAARVSEVMSGNIVSLSPDDDENTARKLMSDNDVRRLPVCQDDRLVGMVSVGDLAVRTDERHAGEVMEKTGPPA